MASARVQGQRPEHDNRVVQLTDASGDRDHAGPLVPDQVAHCDRVCKLGRGCYEDSRRRDWLGSRNAGG
jgi:hypothetical protein